MTTRYLVSGCGLSVLCDSKDSVIAWMKEMVSKGGTPEVRELKINE